MVPWIAKATGCEDIEVSAIPHNRPRKPRAPNPAFPRVAVYSSPSPDPIARTMENRDSFVTGFSRDSCTIPHIPTMMLLPGYPHNGLSDFVRVFHHNDIVRK